MDRDRLSRLEELYHAAMEQPPGKRIAFLADACGADAELRREVELLLEHSAEGVLDRSPWEVMEHERLVEGSQLGSYRILNRIGAGGMGVVYRAQDTRLDRTVAIKVLPPLLALHPEARDRFEREARAISSLNHPNICTLYDVGNERGIEYLVMEYLEGETLAERHAKSVLPLDRTLTLAIQMADALEAAHRQGIVHRDLKPANVMLTKSGVKLLDFGLAKTAATPPAPGATVTTGLTTPGAVVGTVQYMSPEQLEGKEVDARTDIFAFGAVLYEMLTGRKAFEGSSQASMIAAIMSSDPPPVSRLQPLIPPELDRIVRTCLAKDPDRRWQSARDIRLQLEAILEPGPVEARRGANSRQGLEKRIWLAAAMVLAALLMGGVIWFLRAPATPAAQMARFQIPPPDNASFASLQSAGGIRLSPDGRELAFVARFPGGRNMVWIRPIDSLAAHALAGTEGAAHIFWSPDSRFVAFFADGKLKKIDAEEESGRTAVQIVCSAPDGRSGSWGRGGVILFSTLSAGPLFRVAGNGGLPSPALGVDRRHNEFAHRWPSFLPDGRQYLFLSVGQMQNGAQTETQFQGIYRAALDSSDRTFLMNESSNVDYTSLGYLLFVRERTLMARPYDVGRLRLSGDAFQVEPRVGYVTVSGGNFSAGANGTLAYGTGDDIVTTQMVWHDRGGKRLGTIGDPGGYRQPQLSPDGSKMVVERLDPQSRESHIWMYDLARGVNARLTAGPGWHFIPIVSGDMSRIAYDKIHNEDQSVFQKPATGTGNEELLFPSKARSFLCDWSRDGKFILLVLEGAGTREDLWVVPAFGSGKPFPFLQTEFSESQGQFSPDGKWIAYASDETGRPEIYVQSFPATGKKWQISINGGTQPRWRGDGKELFYLGADRKMMAAPVISQVANFTAGAPTALFQTQTASTDSELGPYIGFNYAVASDGKRFLLNEPQGAEISPAISVVLNWTAGLARHSPVAANP